MEDSSTKPGRTSQIALYSTISTIYDRYPSSQLITVYCREGFRCKAAPLDRKEEPSQ